MKEPLVSIIIPCYNYGHFIGETLNSLLKQEYTNWEAVVIDDGSVDNTFEVVNSFINQDNRVTYYYQSNTGLSAARNKGIEISKGKYITFLDADDLFSPRKIKIQIEYMVHKNPRCTISYTFAKYFHTDKPQKLYIHYNLNNQEWMPKVSGSFNDILPVFIYTIMPVNSPLIRKSFLEKNKLLFNTEYKSYEDWEFWLRCLYHGAIYSYIPDPEALALIRVHSYSMRTNSLTMNIYEFYLRKKMFFYINQYPADKTEMLAINKLNFKIAYKRLIRPNNKFSWPGIKICFKEQGSLFTFRRILGELNAWRKGINNI